MGLGTAGKTRKPVGKGSQDVASGSAARDPKTVSGTVPPARKTTYQGEKPPVGGSNRGKKPGAEQEDRERGQTDEVAVSDDKGKLPKAALAGGSSHTAAKAPQHMEKTRVVEGNVSEKTAAPVGQVKGSQGVAVGAKRKPGVARGGGLGSGEEEGDDESSDDDKGASLARPSPKLYNHDAVVRGASQGRSTGDVGTTDQNVHEEREMYRAKVAEMEKQMKKLKKRLKAQEQRAASDDQQGGGAPMQLEEVGEGRKDARPWDMLVGNTQRHAAVSALSSLTCEAYCCHMHLM